MFEKNKNCSIFIVDRYWNNSDWETSQRVGGAGGKYNERTIARQSWLRCEALMTLESKKSR